VSTRIHSIHAYPHTYTPFTPPRILSAFTSTAPASLFFQLLFIDAEARRIALAAAIATLGYIPAAGVVGALRACDLFVEFAVGLLARGAVAGVAAVAAFLGFFAGCE